MKIQDGESSKMAAIWSRDVISESYYVMTSLKKPQRIDRVLKFCPPSPIVKTFIILQHTVPGTVRAGVCLKYYLMHHY